MALSILKTVFTLFFVCLFTYFERGRQNTGVREGQRERVRERILNRFCAVSTEPNMGLNPMNHAIML